MPSEKIDFSNIQKGLFSITNDWLDESLTRRLFDDARALKKHGSFTNGQLGGMAGQRM
jgi:hypothetical protein